MVVKVCGMREGRNIMDVEQTGADWMGFICYERSPRHIGTCPTYLPTRCRRVGVFVNAPIPYIYNKVEELGLTHIQLHGDETPTDCRLLQDAGLTVIKAFQVHAEPDLTRARAYADACSYYLFDTPTPGYGGSGRTFDWGILRSYDGPLPFLLSGGLGPHSLEALSSFAHPLWAGIDLNSGFETSPGMKDASALQVFIKQFKALHQ